MLIQAVNALAMQPTAIVSSTLTKTVLVSNYHYRIRCEAASALVQVRLLNIDVTQRVQIWKLVRDPAA